MHDDDMIEEDHSAFEAAILNLGQTLCALKREPIVRHTSPQDIGFLFLASEGFRAMYGAGVLDEYFGKLWTEKQWGGRIGPYSFSDPGVLATEALARKLGKTLPCYNVILEKVDAAKYTDLIASAAGISLRKVEAGTWITSEGQAGERIDDRTVVYYLLLAFAVWFVNRGELHDKAHLMFSPSYLPGLTVPSISLVERFLNNPNYDKQLYTFVERFCNLPNVVGPFDQIHSLFPTHAGLPLILRQLTFGLHRALYEESGHKPTERVPASRRYPALFAVGYVALTTPDPENETEILTSELDLNWFTVAQEEELIVSFNQMKAPELRAYLTTGLLEINCREGDNVRRNRELVGLARVNLARLMRPYMKRLTPLAKFSIEEYDSDVYPETGQQIRLVHRAGRKRRKWAGREYDDVQRIVAREKGDQWHSMTEAQHKAIRASPDSQLEMDAELMEDFFHGF